MSLEKYEEVEARRLIAEGLSVPIVTCRILNERVSGSYAEMVLEVEEIKKIAVLRELEEIVVRRKRDLQELEKVKVKRMVKEGLPVGIIARNILDARGYGGYAETLLDVEEMLRADELSDAEKIVVKRYKSRGFDTLTIMTIILEDRHNAEICRLLEVINIK